MGVAIEEAPANSFLSNWVGARFFCANEEFLAGVCT